MLSMQDYINNIKQQNIYNNLNSNIDKQSTTSDLSLNLKSIFIFSHPFLLQ